MARKITKTPKIKKPAKKRVPRQKSAAEVLYAEFFEEGDARFLQELFACRDDKPFKTFAKKWYHDNRPFARDALYQYVDDGCDRPAHRLLVKRLFKFAEEAGDHELMGRFLVAFDRLSKRKIEETKRGKDLVPVRHPQIQNSFESKQDSKIALRFTRVTRHYLQRRAWRYFRFLAFRDEALYWQEIKKILLKYRDEHLTKPEQLLDSWGLLHIMYWGSPVIERRPRGAVLRKKKTLAQLAPAPFRAHVFKGRFDELFEMLFSCQSRTVRAFLHSLIKKDFKPDVKKISLKDIRRLLSSQHEELQNWGMALLQESKGLDTLGVADWLTLIQLQNATIAPMMAELAEKNINTKELSTLQCVSLALVGVSNVAKLGLSLCLKRAEREGAIPLLSLGNAEVPEVRSEAVAYLVGELAASPEARSEHLRELIDAKHADTRAEALSMMQNDVRYRDSVVLWGAMSESPYDDVKAHLLKHLQERAATFTPNTLRFVWASVLLAIHQGSRTKQTVLKQLAERLAKYPDELNETCSLLAIALRSVRGPERRGAIAAIAKTAWQRPDLKPRIEAALPELRLFTEAA